MQNPTLKEEQKLWRKGYRYVCGVDEVGIGPLAGSVTAAAVTLPAKFKIQNSKFKIQNRQRLKKAFSITERTYL